jgi:hypothetical protein
VLEIKLGDYREVGEGEELFPLERTAIGWQEGMTPQQAWESARGVWKLRPDRAINEQEVRVVNRHGEIVAVANLRGLIRHDDRFELVGDLVEDDATIGSVLDEAERSRSQNPVRYIETK